MTLVAAYIIES